MSSLLKKAFLNAKKENRPALLTYTVAGDNTCLLYTSPSPRDVEESRMPSSA